MEALQYDLVLPRDFHQFSLASLPVQALLDTKLSLRHRRCRLGGCGNGALVVDEMGVCMRDALWVLKDIGHLL